jgi:hypothetical protein
VLVDFNQLDAGLLHNEWVADDNIPDLFIGVANQRPAEHRLTVLFDRMGVFLAKQDEQGIHIPVAVWLLRRSTVLTQETSGKYVTNNNLIKRFNCQYEILNYLPFCAIHTGHHG